MKLLSVYAVAGSSLLVSSVLARRGLSPDTIPPLTRTVKYTFIQICDEVQNPTPQPMFNEAGLARTVMGVSRDLYTFLMGYSLSTSIEDRPGPSERTFFSQEPWSSSGDNTHPPADDLLDDLVDELLQSQKTADIFASRDRFDSHGPEDAALTEQQREPTTHNYAGRGFNCGKFQRDIKD
ncbi:MAG: hypothetical protein Q9210_006981, partial [Variospora velana]